MPEVTGIDDTVVKATNAQTVIARGTAGATLVAGEVLYPDATDEYKLKLAVNTAEATAQAAGIALHGASADQPIAYAKEGDVTFNAVFDPAQAYILTSTAGVMGDTEEIDTDEYGTLIGISVSDSVLRLSLTASGATRPA